MKHRCLLFCTGSLLLFSSLAASSSESDKSRSLAPSPSASSEREDLIYFTPPSGWMLADPAALPGKVKTMVIGKALSSFPPSINLSTEPYSGTLKQYLKIVKNMNSAQGYEWKDLGTIQTAAGTASLSQVDTKSQWGTIRLMHVILVREGSVYILTASALKNEFPSYYKDFFASLKSLRIIKDPYEMIDDRQLRKELQTCVSSIEEKWKLALAKEKSEKPEASVESLQELVFQSEEFQNNVWKPFKETLKKKYYQAGEEWQSLFAEKTENQLFNIKP